jgi:hypothetical protein
MSERSVIVWMYLLRARSLTLNCHGGWFKAEYLASNWNRKHVVWYENLTERLSWVVGETWMGI